MVESKSEGEGESERVSSPGGGSLGSQGREKNQSTRRAGNIAREHPGPRKFPLLTPPEGN